LHLLRYIISIDTHIAIFRQYSIDTVSETKSDVETSLVYAGVASRQAVDRSGNGTTSVARRHLEIAQRKQFIEKRHGSK